MSPTFSTLVPGNGGNGSTKHSEPLYEPIGNAFPYTAIPSFEGKRPHSRFAIGMFNSSPSLTYITQTISQPPIAHPTEFLVLLVPERPLRPTQLFGTTRQAVVRMANLALPTSFNPQIIGRRYVLQVPNPQQARPWVRQNVDVVPTWLTFFHIKGFQLTRLHLCRQFIPPCSRDMSWCSPLLLRMSFPWVLAAAAPIRSLSLAHNFDNTSRKLPNRKI